MKVYESPYLKGFSKIFKNFKIKKNKEKLKKKKKIKNSA